MGRAASEPGHYSAHCHPPTSAVSPEQLKGLDLLGAPRTLFAMWPWSLQTLC